MVVERVDKQGHVVIISHDVVGEQMAGPGIRYYHLAQVLAREFEVVLAVPVESTLRPSPSFSTLSYRPENSTLLEEAVQGARMVLVPAVWLVKLPFLLQPSVSLVIDGYDPCLAETLSMHASKPNELECALTKAYLAGDFFICASERQRDWWLGLLEAHGRINAHTFAEDPSLRRLIDVVPFGMPDTSPQHTRKVMKGTWPGVGEEDRVILWGGGLWQWLDPLTAIRAVAKVWRHRQDVRLVFPGIRHPNPSMRDMPSHNQAALQTARDLGILDSAVFFKDWTPYADWPNVLLESDIAVTLHRDTLETRLAFRSRVLDYIWARLPIVAARGDATSEMITRYQVGVVVDYGDVDGVSEAIRILLDTPREAYAERFEKARQELTWEQAAQPLVRFCRHPRQAPDKVAMGCKLGNPFYLSKIARLQALVDGYERGHFIRMMRRLHRLRERSGLS